MAAAVAPGLPPRRSLRGVLIASAGCFLALALAVGFTSSLPGDTAVREALLALASPPVLAAMRVINRAGSWQLLLPGSLLLRSEEHTSELQSQSNLVCRLLLEKKKY